MYDDEISIMEMPEHDNISLCLFIEKPALFALGERITARHPEAYMNGYGWEALINHYMSAQNPAIMAGIGTDPEAGMYAAYSSHNSANLNKMQALQTQIKAMLADETRLMAYIDQHVNDIEWD